MPDQVLINQALTQTRLVYLKDGIVQKLSIEYSDSILLGSIYLGVVTRILPDLKAVFVDIGLPKMAFLEITKTSAHQNLYVGQRILVQVKKEAISTKSIKVSTELSLIGRFFIYQPIKKNKTTLHFSNKLTDDFSKNSLKKQITELLDKSTICGHLIVRTQAKNTHKENLYHELNHLEKLYQFIDNKRSQLKKPALIYQEIPAFLQILKEISTDTKVLVDDKNIYSQLIDFNHNFIPNIFFNIQYQKKEDLVKILDIDQIFNHTLKKKIDLPSGGFLVIEQTEAMTIIDVNSGSLVKNIKNIYQKTNIEAIFTIFYELTLRQIGGIVMIDFINLQSKAHQDEMLSILHAKAKEDAVKTQIINVDKAGIVILLRQRRENTLKDKMTQICPTCQGAGSIKTPKIIVFEIMQEILDKSINYPKSAQLQIKANQAVIQYLEQHFVLVEMLSQQLNKTISLKIVDACQPIQYAINFL